MTAVFAFILGMGLPTAIAYILSAIVAAPALVSLGITPIQVHMFLLYMSVFSMITPPVALAAYAASTVAQADFWRTGLFASALSVPAFVIPFIFIFHEPLLLIGSVPEVAFSFLTAAAGSVLIAFALLGALKNKRDLVLRSLAFISGFILMLPNVVLNVIVVALLIVAGVYYFIKNSKPGQAASA